MKEYKAKKVEGTGMTRQEIQDAIDKVSEAGGGEVRIPAGIHSLDDPIRLPAHLPIRFIGEGAASELRAQYDDDAVIIIEDPKGRGGSREFSKDIGHLKLSRHPDCVKLGDTSQVGLLVKSAAYCNIHDLHLTHQECGIKIEGDSANSTIRDCWFLLNIQEGIRVSGGNYSIERNFIEAESVGIYLDQSESVWIRDCKILNGGGYEYGIIVRGEGRHTINIIQCTLEGAQHSAIYFTNGINRSSILDCWIGSSSLRPEGGGGNGIKLEPDCNKIIISRNRIGGLYGSAVEAYRVHGIAINDNILDQNCTSKEGSVITLSGHTREVSIRNNRFEGGYPRAGIELARFGGGAPTKVWHSHNDFTDLDDRGIPREIETNITVSHHE